MTTKLTLEHLSRSANGPFQMVSKTPENLDFLLVLG